MQILTLHFFQLLNQIHGNTVPGEVFSVVFESFFCVIPFADEVYTDGVALFVEVIVPVLLCSICAVRLKITTKEIPTMMPIDCINHYLVSYPPQVCLHSGTFQLWIASIHFSTSFWYYFSPETKQWLFSFIPSPMDHRDVLCLLPYISSSLTWYPASDLSAFWSMYEVYSNSFAALNQCLLESQRKPRIRSESSLLPPRSTSSSAAHSLRRERIHAQLPHATQPPKHL